MEGRADRVRFLFLEQPEERTHFIHPGRPRSAPVITHDPIEPPDLGSPPSLTGSLSTISTVSSQSRYGDSDASSSRRSATVTVASTVIAPPGDGPNLDQYLLALPHYGYDYPCEFEFIGCFEHFHPLHFDSWLSHTLSHFAGIPPPPKAVCLFCDAEFDRAKRGIDAAANWHERMLHIGGHFEADESPDAVRPDYFVINHMRDNGLSSREDYKHANKFTERPYCPNLVPLGYQTAEMKMKKERALQVHHNLDKERRLQRRENDKHKGKAKVVLESSTPEILQ